MDGLKQVTSKYADRLGGFVSAPIPDPEGFTGAIAQTWLATTVALLTAGVHPEGLAEFVQEIGREVEPSGR